MGTDPSTDEDEELSLGVLLDSSPLLSLPLESRSSVKREGGEVSSVKEDVRGSD